MFSALAVALTLAFSGRVISNHDNLILELPTASGAKVPAAVAHFSAFTPDIQTLANSRIAANSSLFELMAALVAEIPVAVTYDLAMGANDLVLLGYVPFHAICHVYSSFKSSSARMAAPLSPQIPRRRSKMQMYASANRRASLAALRPALYPLRYC